jgi:hypothetical protein
MGKKGYARSIAFSTFWLDAQKNFSLHYGVSRDLRFEQILLTSLISTLKKKKKNPGLDAFTSLEYL